MAHATWTEVDELIARARTHALSVEHIAECHQRTGPDDKLGVLDGLARWLEAVLRADELTP